MKNLYTYKWRCIALREFGFFSEDLNLLGVRRGWLLRDCWRHCGLGHDRGDNAPLLIALAELSPTMKNREKFFSNRRWFKQKWKANAEKYVKRTIKTKSKCLWTLLIEVGTRWCRHCLLRLWQQFRHQGMLPGNWQKKLFDYFWFVFSWLQKNCKCLLRIAIFKTNCSRKHRRVSLDLSVVILSEEVYLNATSAVQQWPSVVTLVRASCSIVRQCGCSQNVGLLSRATTSNANVTGFSTGVSEPWIVLSAAHSVKMKKRV